MKECYYYLDSTPTHSYMKALYKYPQNEYPYSWLVDENRRRSRQEPEFELCDTGEKILFIVPEKLPIKLTSSQFRVHPLLHLCEDSSLASNCFFFVYMYGLRDSPQTFYKHPLKSIWNSPGTSATMYKYFTSGLWLRFRVAGVLLVKTKFTG